jgi:hypothetical protein
VCVCVCVGGWVGGCVDDIAVRVRNSRAQTVEREGGVESKIDTPALQRQSKR